MSVFVGCDLGTTGSKAAVVDESGAILAEAYEEVPIHRPRPGQVEQDPLEIEASAHRVVAQAVHRSGRARDVAGVAFSGQMSGIGTIGDGFEPATPYDSWLDTRCAPYVALMGESADRVVELSGCPPTASHGPKILWWKHERAEAYARIRRFVPIAPFVAARAAGLAVDETFVDHTYLHFSNLADTRAGTWSPELLSAFDVDPDMLPRIVAPTQIVGEVTHRAAATTGLPVGTPIAAGAGDTTAASLGAGVVRPGRALDAAGTASVLAVCVDTFAPDTVGHTIMASRGIVPGTFVNLAFINGGGLALRWFRDEVARLDTDDAYQLLDEQAAAVAPGADGLLWYPHVQGRVLPPAPHASGAWVGLTPAHGHGHLYRAILEGVALEYAQWARATAAAGGSAPTEARVMGGGGRSRLWNQIKADVLGIDWVPTSVAEAGVLGNALVAAAATGHVHDMVATIEQWQGTGERVRPRPQVRARYDRLGSAYRELVDALTPVFEQIDDAEEADRG